MKEQIKSRFDGNINGVSFYNEQYFYYWVRGIIDTLEEYYEIEIDDEDFVLFLKHIRYEWKHNVLYAENLTDGGVDDYIYDFIIEALTEDINFDMIADLMNKKREENRKNPLSEILTKVAYEGISGFDMLCQKCTQVINVSGKYNDILKEKYGKDFVKYSEIIDDFKQRFDKKHIQNPLSTINCLA